MLQAKIKGHTLKLIKLAGENPSVLVADPTEPLVFPAYSLKTTAALLSMDSHPPVVAL